MKSLLIATVMSLLSSAGFSADTNGHEIPVGGPRVRVMKPMIQEYFMPLHRPHISSGFSRFFPHTMKVRPVFRDHQPAARVEITVPDFHSADAAMEVQAAASHIALPDFHAADAEMEILAAASHIALPDFRAADAEMEVLAAASHIALPDFHAADAEMEVLAAASHIALPDFRTADAEMEARMHGSAK